MRSEACPNNTQVNYVINRADFAATNSGNSGRGRLDVRVTSCSQPRLREALRFESAQRQNSSANPSLVRPEASNLEAAWVMSKRILSLGFGTFADLAEQANELAGRLVRR